LPLNAAHRTAPITIIRSACLTFDEKPTSSAP
jgi:hypothetical protein